MCHDEVCFHGLGTIMDQLEKGSANHDAAVAERGSAGRLMPIFQYRFGAGIQKLRHLVNCGVAGRASGISLGYSRSSVHHTSWRH